MESPPTPHPYSTDASKALRASESRYRRLFETAQDGILLLNADTAQIEDVNPYLIDLLGYSHAEFLGKKLWEMGPFADRAESKEMFAELQTTGYVRYEDLPLKTKTGAQIEVEFVSNTYESEGIKVIQCNIRDITERKATEAKSRRHAQLYAALSQCNQAIVHCASEDELFLQICRAAVQFGGMKMAWIGLIDSETLRVQPVASFGNATEYLKDINVSVDADTPFGCGPTGTAIREDRLYWCQDYLDDPATVPWQERATHAGLAAAAALPLHRKGVVIGAFTLYTGEINAFDEAARDLLVEMARDISFALDNLAGESQRKQAEEEIAFKNAILKTQQETSLDAILVVDENGQIISYNQHFIALWQLSPQLVSAGLDAPVLQSVADQVENADAFVARVQYLNTHRDDKSREELRLKDGRVIDQYSAPSTGADGKYHGRVWYFRDITQRKRAEVQVHELAEQLTTTLESITDAFFTVDREWRFTFLNRKAEQLLKRTRTELTGHDVWTEFPELIGSTFEREFRRAMVDNHAVNFEALYQPFNTWFSVHAYPSEHGLAVYFQDISERRNAEKLLRDLEQLRLVEADKQAAILNALPAHIALLDGQGRIISVNETWRQFADANALLSSEYGIGLNYLKICDSAYGDHAAEAEQAAAGIRSVLTGMEKDFSLEYPCHSPTEQRWFQMTVTLLADAHPNGVVVMHLNITQRKRAEVQVHELAEQLTATLESITDAFFTVDREWRFTFLNRKAEQLLRRTRTELTGQDFWTEFPDTIGSTFEREYRRAMADKHTVDFEEFYPPLNTWFSVRAYPSEQGLAVYFQDIGERKKVESRLRAEEERHRRQRNALIELAGGGATGEDLLGTIRRITEIDAKTLGVARTSIWRYNEDRTAIRCMDLYEVETGGHTAGMELSAKDCPAYFRALAAQDHIVAEDAQSDARTHQFSEGYLKPLGITSMLDVPIHLGGTEAGVLCHEHVGPMRQWTADEESFAVAVANQTSLALEWSERKRSEQAIKQAVQRLKEAQRIGQIGDWEFDITTEEVIWSPQVFEILGRDPRLGLPRNYEEVAAHYDAASQALERGKVALAIESGEAQEYELVALRPNGKPVDVLVRIVPRKDESGTVVGLYGTVQDITQRKRAEIALRKSEERFKTMFQQAPLGIAVIDSFSGHIYEINKRFSDIAGRPMEELANIDWLQITHPDDVQVDLENMALLNAGKINGFQMEKRYLRPDGSDVWINMTVSPLSVEDKTRPRHLCMIQDITERRVMDSRVAYLNRVHAMLSGINTLIVRVQDSEELFKEACRVAVETGGFSMAMIGMLDRDTMKIVPVASAGKDEALIDAIKSILSSAELASITMVARAIKEKKIIVSNDSQSDPQVLLGKKYAEAGVHSMAILPLIVADEAIGGLALYATESNFFHEEELKLLSDLAGDISYAMGYLKAEAALRSLNEELEDKVATRTADLEQARLVADDANHAKSDFLAAMSHEIRTPMNGVIGMIDVLKQSSLNEVQVEMADIIQDSAYALLDVINDILDFSKIEAGKITLDSAPISLTKIVEGVGDMLAHTAFKNNVSLRLFIDPALPEQIIGDAGRLRQILVNLASNAIKFSGRQVRPGKVSLRARLLVNTGQNISVEFSVTDNGIGMDKATQVRLFTPFTQANSSTSAKFGGTGLGLVITQQLVYLMGGDIFMRSELGKGTEMRVRLPFERLPQSRDAGKQPSPLAGLGCLIVGFEEGLADDLAAYLAHAGAQSERGGDVDTARRWLGDCPAGQYVVVFDHTVAESVRADLRAIVRSRSNLKMGFVVNVGYVVIGRGERRHSRVEADDLVTLDGDSLHFSELVRAVGIAAGRISPEIETRATPHSGKQAIAQPSREMAIQQGSLILVAEDNEINQKVVLQQLRLLGRTADVANNGRDALEMWQSGEYSILLTDLNMPEMNGYDLSAAIRTAEDGKSRIPIIALTANALKGEAERCMEMGMDDYLSKPVQLTNLKATLDKWLSLVGEDASIDSKPHQANTSVPVDVSVLKALVGDDEEIIREFLHDFRLSAARIGSDLHVACDAGQAIVAGDLMHKLKSSARSVGALALGELCAEMEAAGKAGNTETLVTLLPLFEQELDAVNAFLDSLQAQRADRRDDKYKAIRMSKSTIRILVLDDESFMLKLLAHMLADLGFTSVTTCDNGAEALQLVSASGNPPNLILLDLQMPEMDGIEFVRKLVEHNYTGNLILVSGEDERVLKMAEKLIQAHRFTVLGHLNKPVSLDPLSMLMEKSVHMHAAPQSTKSAYGAGELRTAIDSGELVNYYQPKVAVTTGAVVGVETLVRWRHPVDGMVFPDQFIGIAEDHGLIDDLTRVVLKDAMAQSKAWQQAGLRLRVAVNVSMDNLSSVAFADFVAGAATAVGVAPQDIVLEVTESRLMLDQRAPLEVLTRLRLKRFRLSIDDFGTGHSSLTQLRDIPFDELKIDQSFVRGAWRDDTARAIYDASLSLGKQLGMEVVAEGVEDRDDWDMVRRTKCDLAQGFFIARPMPAADLPGWIESWNERMQHFQEGLS